MARTSLTVVELASNYARQVPFRIQVVNGFVAAGNTKEPNLQVGEIYSVHQVKESRVAVVKFGCNTTKFHIPINSAARFGLIHDKENECKNFERVSYVLNSKPIPKVVAVTSLYVSPK